MCEITLEAGQQKSRQALLALNLLLYGAGKVVTLAGMVRKLATAGAISTNSNQCRSMRHQNLSGSSARLPVERDYGVFKALRQALIADFFIKSKAARHSAGTS